MEMTEAERRELVDSIIGARRRLDDGGGGPADEQALVDLAHRYTDGLPRIALSRCPLTGAVQDHSFDPWGLDGPWWDYEDPARPLMERIPTCIAVTGAVALGEPVEDFPWLCRPGPGIPYVLPRLLAVDGVHAVVREVPVGAHRGFAICYFAVEPPSGVALPNAWGAGAYWDDSDGLPDRHVTIEAAGARAFSLSPWIARGKLFWVAPGDETLTLRSDVAGCPFVGLPGELGEQRVAHGRVTRADSPAPPPRAKGEAIGEFEMYELDDGLREDLGLPPLPAPVRSSRREAVFPPGSPVDLPAMLEEAGAFVAANPGTAKAYGPFQASLGMIAGLAAAERGAHDEALACYDSALRLAPESVSLRSHRALALYALGRTGESREAMEELVRSLPRGQVLPLVWMLLARRYVEDGEAEKARPLLDELGQVGGDDPAIARFRAALSGEATAPPPATGPQDAVTLAEEPEAGRTSGGSGKWVIAALVVLAVGLGAFAASKVFMPGAPAPAPSTAASALPAAAASGYTPESEAAPSDAGSGSGADPLATIARALPGIWAPEQGGCASGFGFAFTAAGRYGEGDEYMGEEGTWEVSGDHLIETVTQTFKAEDDVGERKVSSASKRYEYRIKNFSGDRMVLVNGEAEMAFVRCPEGRHIFIDGETYP